MKDAPRLDVCYRPLDWGTQARDFCVELVLAEQKFPTGRFLDRSDETPAFVALISERPACEAPADLYNRIRRGCGSCRGTRYLVVGNIGSV